MLRRSETLVWTLHMDKCQWKQKELTYYPSLQWQAVKTLLNILSFYSQWGIFVAQNVGEKTVNILLPIPVFHIWVTDRVSLQAAVVSITSRGELSVKQKRECSSPVVYRKGAQVVQTGLTALGYRSGKICLHKSYTGKWETVGKEGAWTLLKECLKLKICIYLFICAKDLQAEKE